MKMEFVYQERADLRLERMTCFRIVIVTAVYMLLQKREQRALRRKHMNGILKGNFREWIENTSHVQNRMRDEGAEKNG